MHRGDVVLDHGDLLQRRHDEQLQIELAEQFEPVAGAFIGTPSKRFVDHDETEALAPQRDIAQPELIGERRRENRVGELLLLAARFPR